MSAALPTAAWRGIAVRAGNANVRGDCISSPDILTILAATIRDVSFWTGLVTVFAFSQGRFSEKQVDIENIDPPLPARYFTSRFRYHSSALVFAGGYVILYVILIVMGSLPIFQDILKPLFGSLSGTSPQAAAPSDPGATASSDIGTPAWAAMVMMVVAPTVPWVKRIERTFRLWLQEFSDTPFKARGLADELIQSMLTSAGPPPRLEDATEAQLVTAFTRLEALRRALTTSGRNKRDQRYREFFAEQGEILAATLTQIEAIEAEIAPAPGAQPAPPAPHDDAPPRPAAALQNRRMRMAILVRRFARLIACALLYSESEEYAVRERLREMPHLAGFARASFQFTVAQVVVALFMIAIVAIVSGPIVSVTMNLLADGQVTPAQLVAQIGEWAGRGTIMAVSFVLPLFLVAAIRLYMIDLAVYGRGDLRWHETLVAMLLAFVGCYGLSALPVVAYEAYNAGPAFNSTNLAVALFSALPPAIVNAAFVKLSEVRWRGTATRNATLDFAAFAALGGAAATLSSSLVTLTYLQGTPDFSGFFVFFRWEIAFIVTVALVSGLNGALQCGASRVIATDALARAHTGIAEIPAGAAAAGRAGG